MNRVELIGRLTRDPELTYSNELAIARYSIAVPRKYKKEGDEQADYISITSFGKSAEFSEKYFRQGMKIAVCGHIQTGSYINKDGIKVYTTTVVAEEQEFAESKKDSATKNDGFENIDAELPFE